LDGGRKTEAEKGSPRINRVRRTRGLKGWLVLKVMLGKGKIDGTYVSAFKYPIAFAVLVDLDVRLVYTLDVM